MKKIAIFFLVIVIIVAGVFYIYLTHKVSYNQAKQENKQFESYYQQEIYGNEVTSLINKAYDSNLTNQVNKNNKGIFENNETNSIQIDIKMLDNDKTYQMETLYQGGMEEFVKYYGEIKFKCTKIEHHKTTNKVSYMLFEQITQ